jgi:hypothetical protein
VAAIARFGAQMVRVEGTNADSVAEGHARCSRSSGNVSDRGLREVAPIPTRLWSAVEHRSGFRKVGFGSIFTVAETVAHRLFHSRKLTAIDPARHSRKVPTADVRTRSAIAGGSVLQCPPMLRAGRRSADLSHRRWRRLHHRKKSLGRGSISGKLYQSYLASLRIVRASVGVATGRPTELAAYTHCRTSSALFDAGIPLFSSVVSSKPVRTCPPLAQRNARHGWLARRHHPRRSRSRRRSRPHVFLPRDVSMFLRPSWCGHRRDAHECELLQRQPANTPTNPAGGQKE